MLPVVFGIRILKKKMNKREILRKTGNTAQLFGVRELQCTSGKAAGLRLLQVHNAAGLEFTVIPDKCMDIFDLRFHGVNFAFQTKNGLVGNQWYNPMNTEFLDYWSAGMLCTCGLENTGPSCTNADGQILPLHGRIGMIPADNLCVRQFWQDDDFRIEIEGQMRECRLEGHNLLLTRKISLSGWSDTIWIEDTIENQGHTAFNYMLLYHMNFGYPFIDEGTRVHIKSNGSVIGRTLYSQTRTAFCNRIEPVEDGVEEEVFFHDVLPAADGLSRVHVENHALGMGAEILYSYETLPILSQWKFAAPGEYVLGIEPGNSHIEGRQEGQKNGDLKTIQPDETVHFGLGLRMYTVKSTV